MNDKPVMFEASTARRVVAATRVVEQDAISAAWEQIAFGRRRTFDLCRFMFSSNTRDGANWRFAYIGRPKIKGAAGHGGWINDPRFAADVTIYNDFEDANGATGTVSGYVLDDGSNDTRITGIEPLSNGIAYPGRVVCWVEDSVLHVEYRVCIQNMPIVECPPP